ncbi:hypothetical protein ACH4CE_18205 [Streptomyces gelaticus]|uniref:hypothetical protein n=1 Tax=Streptomyces gelaticus TaxID=285446 RepID=UPI003791FDAE
MRAELGVLDTKLPKLPWVTISGKHRNGAIKFTDPEPEAVWGEPEPEPAAARRQQHHSAPTPRPGKGPTFDLKATGGLLVTWFAAR